MHSYALEQRFGNKMKIFGEISGLQTMKYAEIVNEILSIVGWFPKKNIAVEFIANKSTFKIMGIWSVLICSDR